MKKILIVGVAVIVLAIGAHMFLAYRQMNSQSSYTGVQTSALATGTNPIIVSVSPGAVKIGSSIKIRGKNFGDWIKPAEFASLGGNYPIEVFIKDGGNREELLQGTFSGQDISKLSDSDEMIVNLDSRPCVPATTASGCAYGSDRRLVPGKYFVRIEVLGHSSNSVSLVILP